ncbi:delta-endotoxin CytB [Guyanagaster necrorhizus]|uniref:Delta-endotoxin CytB n=1 Tax=Guyanagaster necrorhizus TaxID=856835 RepID=A0A9P8AT84_9AGAR|nr:delta-endotoxin CytB [Guyanagaster necrorhizus MCA 3950]KAG7446930.1 delta-endotoxin CytB [Guyanagaster necrorhizus MCA 3950]
MYPFLVFGLEPHPSSPTALVVHKPAFEQFSKLPKNLEPTVTEVIKFVGHSVKFDDTTNRKQFNWSDFKAALNHHPNGEITFDLFKTDVTSRTDPTAVSMIVREVAYLLFGVLQTEIDLHDLAKITETTFTHLKEKKEKGFADFSKNSSEGNSSWEYRAVFAIPLYGLSTYFYILVTTMRIKADVENEESWDLRDSTPKNFSATIDLMRFIVAEGFKDL